MNYTVIQRVTLSGVLNPYRVYAEIYLIPAASFQTHPASF